MISIQISSTGFKEYSNRLSMSARAFDALEIPMEQLGKKGLALVQSYPPYSGGWRNGKADFTPMRPGSLYKRTKKLQKGWKGKMMKKSGILIQYSLTNNSVKYAHWVQGNDQASVHTPWWMTIDSMTPLLEKEMTVDFEKFVKKASSRL